MTLIAESFGVEIELYIEIKSCFNCKTTRYKILNYLKKAKISIITDVSDKNDIKILIREINSSFQRYEKKFDYFFIF